MESEDPLSQLADIHLPADISWWPPAPGWWALLVLLLLMLALFARQWLLLALRQRRLNAALHELEESYETFREASVLRPDDGTPGLKFLGETNIILRRVALLFFPREDIASLTGETWLHFLDQLEGSHEFSEGPGRALGEAAYRRHFDADAEAVFGLSHRWIKNRYRKLDKPVLIPGLKRNMKRKLKRQGEVSISGVRR